MSLREEGLRGRGLSGRPVSLAAFDFDGTLIDGDAGVHFARHLLTRGYLDALVDGGLVDRLKRLAKLNWDTSRLVYKHLSLHLRYELGELDRHGMVERAYEGFEGTDADLIQDEMARFARDKLPRKLRPDVVDQLEHHIDQDDHAVVLSTGLHGLIWPLRDVLDLDFEVVACRLKRDGGELTGAVEGPMSGAEKATRMVAIARRRGHALDEAFAYGDHEDDAHLLKMVGNPVAVHPTDRMRHLARRKGWPVLAE